MQTFVPDRDFERCALLLDTQRLAKQAVEVYQIMLVLAEVAPDGTHRKPNGWVNHPAVGMWRGSESALLDYQRAVCHELLVNRPKKDGTPRAIRSLERAVTTYNIGLAAGTIGHSTGDHMPAWWGDDRVHSSHRRALYCKSPDHYQHARTEWSETHEPLEAGYRYYWPVPGCWGDLRLPPPIET